MSCFVFVSCRFVSLCTTTMCVRCVVDKKNRSSISNMMLHHFMILLGRAPTLAWHKSTLLSMRFVLYAASKCQFPRNRTDNSKREKKLTVLNKFPNGKIRLLIGIAYTNTHTHAKIKSLTHSRTRTHIRRRRKLFKSNTKSIFRYTAVSYCVTKCECVRVSVHVVLFRCFYRIYVKLCRQSVAKWNDKINNTCVCDFCFKAQAHSLTNTHSISGAHIHVICDRKQSSWFLSFLHVFKKQKMHTHEHTETQTHRHTHSLIQIKLYL